MMLRGAVRLPPQLRTDDRSFTPAALFSALYSQQDPRMGCLPVPLFFLLGVGIGYAVAGQNGALWGAGIGLVAGLIGMAILVKALRGGDGR